MADTYSEVFVARLKPAQLAYVGISRHRLSVLIVIVIVISKFLKRYSKAKRTREPAYSRALRRIKGWFPKGGQEKLRSDFQSTGTSRGQTIAVRVGVVEMGRGNYQMGQGRTV